MSQDIQGQVPGTEIFYSIQGNILRPGKVVPNAVKAFVDDQGRDHRSRDGRNGSRRWIGRRQPLHLSAVADRRIEAGDSVRRKTAHVAYILMAEKDDTNGDSHNNGKYTMYLTVSQPAPDHGPNVIHEGENLNPVKTLRMRYDAWRKTQPASFK